MKAAPAWDVGQPRESNRMRSRCTSTRAARTPDICVGATHCVALNPRGLVNREGRVGVPKKTQGVFLGCPACLAPTKLATVARELQKESRRLGIVDRLAGL